jgi:EAL domain-containing protein (putative c-di-GMP-specific phosphodiesterase class I)
LGWRQPGPDVDQPQAPLDLVDEAGLAVPIGRWVLDTALAEVSGRRAQPGRTEDFRMWVKVAPSLVADPVLVEIVDELTARHGVSSSALGLDIREPSAAALASTETTLRALEERDVLVALDDFGAGPSNLALVQRLPITGLKLAPDLVAALGEEPGEGDPEPADAAGVPDPAAPSHPATASVDSAERAQALSREAAALVRGLIELGRALELTVVAQGVESQDQATELHALGCRYAQGPYLLLDDAPLDDAPLDDAPLDDAPDDDAPLDDAGRAPDNARSAPAASSPDAGGSAPGSTEEPAAVPDRVVPESESLWAPGTLTTGFEVPGSSAQQS